MPSVVQIHVFIFGYILTKPSKMTRTLHNVVALSCSSTVVKSNISSSKRSWLIAADSTMKSSNSDTSKWSMCGVISMILKNQEIFFNVELRRLAQHNLLENSFPRNKSAGKLWYTFFWKRTCFVSNLRMFLRSYFDRHVESLAIATDKLDLTSWTNAWLTLCALGQWQQHALFPYQITVENF